VQSLAAIAFAVAGLRERAHVEEVQAVAA
jgi:hypothetical protein